MGTIVVHAGMPKAGSSSIQSWLIRDAERLRNDGTQLLVAANRGGEPVAVAPYEGGPGVVSSAFVLAYVGFGRDPSTLDRFMTGLDHWARTFPTVVVTAEGFANFFAPPDQAFLAGLQRLGADHDVRIAYYVRPQHTHLEAAWRQWGFRLEPSPSAFVAEAAEPLDHIGTLEHVRSVAPDITFDVRPFRADLLAGGDVVADFAEHFLGAAAPNRPSRENEGLPLDIVNILRTAPPGLLWESEHDNRTLDRVRPVLASVDLPVSPAVARSRHLLQAYCHHRFEPGNQRLIAALGWPTDAFVEAPPSSSEAPDPPTDLAALDELWAPPSAARTRQVLLQVLAARP